MQNEQHDQYSNVKLFIDISRDRKNAQTIEISPFIIFLEWVMGRWI
jgi:hypothetical protein